MLEVNCPQLAQDKRMEERTHMNHASFTLLRKPCQDQLYMISYVTGCLQRYRLASSSFSNPNKHSIVYGSQEQPGEKTDV